MKKSIVAIAGSLVLSAAAYGGTLYVSTGGSDENDGLTSATPLKTVQHAYEVAQAAILGGESEMTVYLASGTHYIQKTVADEKPQFVVTDPVKFVGQGNSPSDVTLRLQYTMDWDGAYDASVVTLNNTGAALVNLTVADGFIFNWGGASTQGAGVSILHGMVSNCVVRNCETRGNNCHVAGVYLGNSDAILSHSTVRNCSTWGTGINSEGWQWSKAGGVQMNAGRIENCVIRNCSNNDDASSAVNAKYAGGVLASGGTIVNCTLVGNSGWHTGGMYAYNSARVYNCVFAGNSLAEGATGGADDHARLWNSEFYFNCASDTVNPIRADQNCIVGTPASFFSDYANGNYAPAFGSPLIDAGSNEYVNETADIAGAVRVQGGTVDIGAYESDAVILVNITAGASRNGSVTIPAGPYVAGEDVTITAVPDAGYVFFRWLGDVPAEYAETASFTFAPEHDVSLTAYFAPVGALPIQYVSTGGSDENNGFTASSPRATVPVALAYLVDNFGAGDIYIAPGTYSLDTTLIVTNDIAITGLGATPENTIVRNNRNVAGLCDLRVIAIDSAGAKVSNLTIADGYTRNWGGDFQSVYREAYGGCVTLYAGIVSNCVIRNGRQYDWNAYAGGIYVGGENALLTHSVIRDCNGGEKDMGWSASKGGGAWVSAGRMENCLVENCQITDPNKTDGAGGIRVTGGMVANCTVLGCSSYHTGGIYAAGGSVVNCAIGLSRHREEGGTVVPWAGGTTRFTNCAADAETGINATCIVAPADELFLGASTGDATPCFGSPLIDNGASVTLSSDTDIAGTARVKGEAIDIGAYEAETEILITVTLEDSDYGTTTGSGDHIAGRSLTITATPIDGYVFYCWDGNFPYEYRTQSSFTFVPTINYTAYPRFVKAGTTAVQYVKTTGSDENDGFTEETARKTIASAVACLSPTYGHGTVYVDPGTHSYDGIIKVTDPIAIVGRGASAADVILRNSTPHNGEYDARILEMRNAGASISGVTLKDGALTSWGASGAYIRGACATIYAGSVSNCVITGGRQSNWQTACGGIGLLGINAFMTHCVVTNCWTTMDDDNSWTTPRAGGVFIEGGRMENCLVTDCQVGDLNAALSASAGGVRLLSGSVVNCTILNCRGRYAGGINAAGGTVTNTVVFGCIDRDDDSISPWSGGAGRFVNCATDGETAINDTCVLITSADFKNYANGNYRPASKMALHDAGAEVTLASGTDLAGNQRVKGRGIDIGAYESQYQAFSVIVR